MADAVYPSLLGALYDACVTAFAPDGTAPDALADTEIFYGIPEELPFCDQLILGARNYEDSDSGDSEQEWATVAPGLARDESGDIQCFVYTAQGDSGNEARREAHERAWALVEVVSGIYRTNLDFGVPNVLWTSLATAQPVVMTTEVGTEVLIPFTLHYAARI